MNWEPLLARLKAGDHTCGVVTSFAGEAGERDRDGWRGLLHATDGNSAGLIELELTGSDGGRYGMEIDPGAVEAAAERVAGRFPAESRVASMIAYCEHIGPIQLHRGDLPA